MDTPNHRPPGVSPFPVLFGQSKKISPELFLGELRIPQKLLLRLGGLEMISNVLNDIRYALRTLRLNPAFAATAILTIALGIGINTGVFSVLNGLALRSPKVPDPQNLVAVHQIVL